MSKTRRFDEILKDYSDKYDLATLSSPNDKANLEMLINNQIIIESIQKKLQELSSDPVDNIDMLQRLSASLKDIIERNLQLERALALDRKTRNQSSAESIADYIVNLKATAQDFLERRLVKLYCPDCKILLARFAVVHNHSAFELQVNCNQCNKQVSAKREELDIFFDIKDAGWRKKHKYTVKQAKASAADDDVGEDDLILGEEENTTDAESEN